MRKDNIRDPIRNNTHSIEILNLSEYLSSLCSGMLTGDVSSKSKIGKWFLSSVCSQILCYGFLTPRLFLLHNCLLLIYFEHIFVSFTGILLPLMRNGTADLPVRRCHRHFCMYRLSQINLFCKLSHYTNKVRYCGHNFHAILLIIIINCPVPTHFSFTRPKKQLLNPLYFDTF